MAKLEEVMELKAKLEKMEAEAKEEQKNLYLKKLAETEAIATKYKELFGEELTFRGKPKKAKAGAQEKTWKPQQPISLDEINSFLTQKKEGKKITLKGRRDASIKKIEEAYEVSDTKDAESILALLA